MTSRRERNNLASKKSYEKAVERAHAIEYEYAVVERHRDNPCTQAWHWSVVPEDHLFEAGYIHDFAKHRLMRLMNKKRVEEGENRLRDYGLDGLAMTTLDSGVVYHGIQAKYYTSRSVTAEDIGSFFAKQISMTIANPLSRGYLYTTTKLQADLADEVAQPTYPIRHVLYPWKHIDKRIEPDVIAPSVPTVNECDLPLRDYQVDVLEELVDGRNAICIPCRMGKTLIAGHWIRRIYPRVVIAIAPLKVSVENLRDRLACFLPGHAPLLVDSDVGGTTDEKEIDAFLETHMGEVVIYSTFQSAMEILAQRKWYEEMVLLVDEAHNATTELCEWVQGFRRCLVMSATFPDDICEAMEIEHKVVVPFSKGIEGGYIVDYTLWLPSLTKHEDGSTSVEADIPVGFEAYERSMVLKALYHAVCMLRTGSRRTIVYLGTQVECDQYMEVCRRVLEEYHGVTGVWMGKMTCSVSSRERKEILSEFQGGEDGSFRILTSVRILDEAVDIPSCDSVFITMVGEHSSDIRFFQRAQRSGTLDPKNPNKRNHIFLWAEGWEKCVGALSLLREADPEFYRKVRHVSAGYDTKELIQERAERVVKERVEFIEWSRMACETVEERMRRKCMLLLEFVEREGRVPRFKETYNTIPIGNWWASFKQGHNHNIYNTILIKNHILKSDYELYITNRDKKGDKMVITPQNKAVLLLEYVEREKCTPSKNYMYNEIALGHWWHHVKQGRCNNIYNTLLIHNKILYTDYNRIQNIKLIKKNIVSTTLQEKCILLLDFVEKEGRPPYALEIVNNVKLGSLWVRVKSRRIDDLYDSLLKINPILRQDYERANQKRAEKNEIEHKTPEEKAKMLMEWVKQEGRVPPQSLEWKGVKLGGYWNGAKNGGLHRELYQTLLSHSPLLKADYDRLQLLKQQKQKQKESD